MEVDEKPTEQYSDVGGLDKQIQELIEAIVLPMVHFSKISCVLLKILTHLRHIKSALTQSEFRLQRVA